MSDTTTATTLQQPNETTTASSHSNWFNLIPIAIVFVIFYFIVIRPQEKKQRRQKELVGSVKKGEQVITHSGIYGTVVKINDSDSTVELSIAKDVVIKIIRNAIADIISRKQVSNTTVKEADKDNK